VDGGDGEAVVELSLVEREAVAAMTQRTMSRPDFDGVTGADLGAGVGAGSTTGNPVARES
jgi:Mn-containing catalase